MGVLRRLTACVGLVYYWPRRKGGEVAQFGRSLISTIVFLLLYTDGWTYRKTTGLLNANLTSMYKVTS